MKKTRILVTLLCLILAFAFFPAGSAEAASDSCGEHATWELTNGTLTIKGSGEMTNYDIGDSAKRPPWYDSRESITAVEVKESVTSIGNDAFRGCSKLARVTISSNLTRIGSYAFGDCSCEGFTDIRLPGSLHTFGEYAFFNAAYLRMVTIPSGVTALPEGLFYHCPSLLDVAVPESVTNIGKSAFGDSAYMHLSDIHYEGSEDAWKRIAITTDTGTNDKALALARIHYNASVDYVQNVPDKTCGRGLSYTLQNGAFTVSGTGWMWDWGDSSSYCRPPWHNTAETITSAELGSGVKSLGAETFRGCRNLASVTLPEGLEEIGAHAFHDCSCEDFTDIRLPESLRTFGEYAFYNTTCLRMVTIPRGVRALPEGLFYHCPSLLDIAVPESVTSIGKSALGDSAYMHLSDIHYEGSEDAWNRIAITTDTGTNDQALALARIHYNASVDYVQNIPGVTCGRGLSYTLQNGAFTVSGNGWMWNWARGSSYATQPWAGSTLATITSAELGTGVRNVGEEAFYGCYNLAHVTLPEGLEEIGKKAFSGCASSEFVDIRLPSTLRRFGEEAFYGAAYLRMISIPSGVTELPDGLFNRCSGLFDVAIPKTVTSIGEYVFYNPSSSIVLCDVYYEGTQAQWSAIETAEGNNGLGAARLHPDASVQYVRYDPASVCGRNVTYAIDESGAMTIRGTGTMWDYAFSSSYAASPWSDVKKTIVSVTIGSGVQNVGAYTFYGCYNLKSLTLPLSVTEIGDRAFYSCESLADVWYGGTEAQRYERIRVNESGNDRLEHKDCVWHYTDSPLALPFRIDALRVYNASGAEQTAVPSGRCLVRVTITRLFDSDDAQVLIAAYGENGRFISELMWVSVDVPVDGTMSVTLPVDNSAGKIAYFKAFVVSDLGDCTPLGEAVSFPG